MSRQLLALATLAGALTLGGAACGGGGESKEEKESEGAKVACTGSAISDTGLPASFPDVQGATLTKTSTAGPSKVVDGYFEGDVEEAHDAYTSAFQNAGYDILFDEVEEHDSEVSYKGNGRTGQVALRDTCEQDGRVFVHITNRPG
jgi:hypothetical protein